MPRRRSFWAHPASRLRSILIFELIEFVYLTYSLINIIMADDGSETSKSCSMTGLLGIIIQLILGVLSFSVLIIKRFR